MSVDPGSSRKTEDLPDPGMRVLVQSEACLHAEAAVDADAEMAEASQAAEPVSNHVASNSHTRRAATQPQPPKQRGTKPRRTRA